MEKRICFMQYDENTENAGNVNIHISADRATALQLLALGTRCVMETFRFSLYEYLEALMESKENPLSSRVTIHISLLHPPEEGERDKPH